MAKITSSSNRSKRKPAQPRTITKGQNPQRANRQAVSTARVSQSGQAKPGSAASRVTTGQGGQSIRQPRAITNGNSATMRQIRAKAVQKQRMASGKTTVASRTPGPSATTRARISQTARSMKPIGDSARVRQATAQGQQAKASAQARRGARQAMSRMEGTLKAARTLRTIAGAAKTLGRGGVAAAVMSPTKLADGTLSAALKRGDYKPKQGPSPSTTQASFNKKTFDQAFKSARTSGAKTFTWRGKKYTTKMKGE